MASGTPHPPAKREAVEALLRDTALSMRAIGAQADLSPSTVQLWNRTARIRSWTRDAKREADPRNWTMRRLAAAARLFGRADIDAGDLAEAVGAGRDEAPALALACGLAVKAARPAPNLAGLDAALRAHVAEQIAASSERLRQEGAETDTARVLRDLGGLNRLLDDLAGRSRRRRCDGDADGEPEPDLAALRERIARRYEAFEAERRHADLPDAAGPGPSDRAGF